MTAVVRPLYVEQGATFKLGFTWHQEGPVVDGVPTAGDPFDLTGWVARMEFRKNQQTPVLASASTTDGKIILTSAGRVDIKLTDEDTDALTSKSCQYDLEMESPEGDVYRVLQGTVTVSPNITQDSGEPVLA